MKIISQFKDFYDFVVTETDNRKVFVRATKDVVFTKEEQKKNPSRTILSPIPREKVSQLDRRDYIAHFDHGHVSVVAFCNKLHTYLQYKNLIYWRYEDIPADVLKDLEPYGRSRWETSDEDYEKYSWYHNPLKDILRYKKIDWVRDRHTKEPYETKLNKAFNAPVLIVKDGTLDHITLNPRLTDIGFNRILTPTEAYQDIYNWIPYNEPEVPSSPTDLSRYEAKGFDKKTSFRPKMK